MRRLIIILQLCAFAFVANSQTFPVQIGFEIPSLVLPAGWAVIEEGTNIDINTWEPVYHDGALGYNASNGFMYIWRSTTAAKSSWLFSEPLTVTANKLYRVSFYYRTQAQGATEYMEVKLGQEQTIVAMTTQIWDNQVINTSEWKKGTCYLQPETDGIYHLSWHAYSEMGESSILLDDILIEELNPGPGAYTQPYTKTLPAAKVNESTAFSLEITNQGTGTLDFISATYPDFIAGPDAFSITDTETIAFEIIPNTQGVLEDVIVIETTGGTLEIPVFGNSAQTAYPILSLTEMYNNFTVVDNNENSNGWQMNWERPFEGQYSFQVQDDPLISGYDDWLITKPVYVTENDVFTFIGRSENDVLFPSTVRIMLSTNAGNTVTDFDVTVAPLFYLPGEWAGYSFDLSAYEGQIVTLAIHSSGGITQHFIDNIGIPHTQNPISCTEAVYPVNSQTNIPLSFSLEWNAAEYAKDYELYFGTDNPPTNIYNGINTGNVNTKNISGLAENTEYFWKAVPINGDFGASACSVQSFTTDGNISVNKLEYSFAISSQKDNIIISNTNLSESYTIEVYTLEGKLIYKRDKISNPKFEKQLEYSGITVVKVISKNNVTVKKILLRK